MEDLDISLIFKALGDKTRLNILVILTCKDFCAKGISRYLNISEAAVSQHLKILKEADIIKGRKSGYYMKYFINKETMDYIKNFINLVTDDKNPELDLINKYNMEIIKDCSVKCNDKHKCCKQK